MLSLGQENVTDPVFAATRRDEESNGYGVAVFLIMASFVTGAIGYAVGFERGATATPRTRKKKSLFDR
jgi:hypothetical protein